MRTCESANRQPVNRPASRLLGTVGPTDSLLRTRALPRIQRKVPLVIIDEWEWALPSAFSLPMGSYLSHPARPPTWNERSWTSTTSTGNKTDLPYVRSPASIPSHTYSKHLHHHVLDVQRPIGWRRPGISAVCTRASLCGCRSVAERDTAY